MRLLTFMVVMVTAGCPAATDTSLTTSDTGLYIPTFTPTDTPTTPTGDTGTPPIEGNTVVVDFEASTPPLMTGFGGLVGAVVADPTDGSNTVGELAKGAATKLWAGNTVSYCPNEGIAALSLSAATSVITMRVYSPDAAVPIRMKVENAADDTVSVETEATVTTANTWETLSFDFSMEVAGTAALDDGATYDKVSVFPNFGTPGTKAGDKTYYIDDITVLDVVFDTNCDTPPSLEGWPLTFDDAGTTYTVGGFGGADDAGVEADPDNAANQVARVTKADNAMTWAGATISTLAKATVPPIPLTAKTLLMTVRVRSPRAGIPIRLKVEDSTNAAFTIETDATTTAVDTWETLTFDLGSPSIPPSFDPAATYDVVVLFPDFGTDGMSGGDGTFYFDDIGMAP